MNISNWWLFVLVAYVGLFYCVVGVVLEERTSFVD